VNCNNHYKQMNAEIVMNKEELTNHLEKLHEKVIAEMQEVVRLKCPKISVVVKPLLYPGGILSTKVNGKEVTQIVMDDTLLHEDIAYAEYTLAHETGHYFHMLNPGVPEEMKLARTLRTRKGKRILNYTEMVANFFAINYFDRTEGIDSFFKGRGSEIKLGSESLTYPFYRNLSVQGREQLCSWLINHSYEGAKRDMHENLFKNSLREIINEK
jgi:hypothetical protein